MPTTNELRDTLGIEGAAFNTLAEAWGDFYAREFCNALLQRLPIITNDCKIHLWVQADGSTQVNIDVGRTGAYTVDYTDDPLEAIGARFANKLVCDTNAV